MNYAPLIDLPRHSKLNRRFGGLRDSLAARRFVGDGRVFFYANPPHSSETKPGSRRSAFWPLAVQPDCGTQEANHEKKRKSVRKTQPILGYNHLSIMLTNLVAQPCLLLWRGKTMNLAKKLGLTAGIAAASAVPAKGAIMITEEPVEGVNNYLLDFSFENNDLGATCASATSDVLAPVTQGIYDLGNHSYGSVQDFLMVK